MTEPTAYLNQIKGLLAKADGKDKMMALIQYAGMFVSAGEAGNALKIQKSFSAARKPMRLYKPVEVAMPLMVGSPKGKGLAVALEYIKTAGMFCYFGADHFVWAGQAGIVTDKETLSNMQKISFWGWFAGSIAGLIQQLGEFNRLLEELNKTSEEEERKAVLAKAQKCMLGITTNSTQAVLALGLLEKLPLDKRQCGALGVFLSALNIYSLAPPLKAKSA